MHAPNSNTLSTLAPGQRYLVNSFDLGFINVQPVDMIVEVKIACYETNELVLAPFPASGEEISETLVRVVQWFRQGYPARTKEDCLLRNVQAFERLVGLGIVVAEKSVLDIIRSGGFLRGWRAPLSAPENRPL